MLNTVKSKKGVTLLEIVIVLVLVSLIAASTVTITVLINKRVKLNENRNQLLSELSDAEVFMRRWFLHYDNSDFVFSTIDRASATDIENNIHNYGVNAKYQYGDENLFQMYFSNNRTLIGGWSDDNGADSGNPRQLSCQFIKSVQFGNLGQEGKIIKSRETARRLIVATVVFTDPDTGEDTSIQYYYVLHAQSHMNRKLGQ